MQIDRARFFAAVRDSSVCGPTLSHVEVDGLTGILDAWEKHGPIADLRHVAYTMATAWHEARLDAGIREIGRGKGKAYGKPAGPYGEVYYGRGPCQLTWLANYETFGKLLGLDLVKNPDLALEPETGAAILIIGSRDGLFRVGKDKKRNTLARFFSASVDDPVGARDIINGDVEKNGRMIAGYHNLFLKALKAAVVLAPVGNVCPTCSGSLRSSFSRTPASRPCRQGTRKTPCTSCGRIGAMCASSSPTFRCRATQMAWN